MGKRPFGRRAAEAGPRGAMQRTRCMGSRDVLQPLAAHAPISLSHATKTLMI